MEVKWCKWRSNGVIGGQIRLFGWHRRWSFYTGGDRLGCPLKICALSNYSLEVFFQNFAQLADQEINAKNPVSRKNFFIQLFLNFFAELEFFAYFNKKKLSFNIILLGLIYIFFNLAPFWMHPLSSLRQLQFKQFLDGYVFPWVKPLFFLVFS